jgi:hypothetical protein
VKDDVEKGTVNIQRTVKFSSGNPLAHKGKVKGGQKPVTAQVYFGAILIRLVPRPGESSTETTLVTYSIVNSADARLETVLYQ